MKKPDDYRHGRLFLLFMLAVAIGTCCFVDLTLPREDRVFSKDLAVWESFGRVFFKLLLRAVGQGLVIALFLVLSIAAHECAHAGVGWLLGLRVIAIQMGTRRLLWGTHWRGVRFELRWVPWAGLVRLGAFSPVFYRTRMFLAILAAPLLNALLLAIAWTNISDPSFQKVMNLFRFGDFLSALAIANAWILVGSVIPQYVWIGDERLASDGLLLLQIPFWTAAAIEEACGSLYALEANECFRVRDHASAADWVTRGLAHYPQNVLLAYYDCYCPFLRGDYAMSQDRVSAFLQRPELPLLYKVQAVDLIATALLLGVRKEGGKGASTALIEAERHCADALAIAEGLPASLGLECRATRGCIWIEQGRLEDGVAELREVLPQLTTASSRAICLSYLALAELRKGNAEAARTLLAEAREAVPDSPVPPTIERDLASGCHSRSGIEQRSQADPDADRVQ